MRERDRPAPRMPRGRQTIRKGGSLTGLHGPTSRRIRLWEFDARSNTVFARLEQAYFGALEAVDRLEAHSRSTAATGKLTPEGMKADALQFARSHLLPTLHRARETISKAKAEVAEGRANLASGHDSEIEQLKQAIAAAESAVEAAHEEVRVEAGVLNDRDFNDLTAPTEQRPRAPWLRRRKDANGMEEIRVVDLERKIERRATPEEIERGVFYKNYDEYQKGEAA